MKRELKKVQGNESFKLPKENGTRRICLEKGTRMKNGIMQVYVCPTDGKRIWRDRGIWVDWNTEVEIVEEIE